MKSIKFQDLDRNEISISYSSNGDFRIYIQNEDTDREIENKKVPVCIRLNIAQSEILINGLRDLMDDF